MQIVLEVWVVVVQAVLETIPLLLATMLSARCLRPNAVCRAGSALLCALDAFYRPTTMGVASLAAVFLTIAGVLHYNPRNIMSRWCPPHLLDSYNFQGVARTEVDAAVMGILPWFIWSEPDGSGNPLLLEPLRVNTPDERALRTARILGRGHETILAAMQNLVLHQAVQGEDTTGRGAGSVHHHLWRDEEYRVRQWLEPELDAAATATVQVYNSLEQMQRRILEVEGIWVSTDRISGWLSEWGFNWGRLRRAMRNAITPVSSLQRLAFTVGLSQALTSSPRRTYVVSQDESYINQHLKYSYGWSKHGEAAWVSSGKGNRLCFNHLFSEIGLVETSPQPGLGDLTTSMPNGGSYFAAQKGKSHGDYHGNFDHTSFMQWAVNRMVPALGAFFPCLSLPDDHPQACDVAVQVDNAPYHIAIEEEHMKLDGPVADRRFDPFSNKLDRPELVDQVQAIWKAMGMKVSPKLDVRAVIKQKGKPNEVVMLKETMDAAQKDKGGKAGVVARIDELRLAVRRWIASTPYAAILRNDFEALLLKHFKHRAYALWNPPNYPEANPIEFVWGRAKGYASAISSPDRSVPSLYARILDGLHTDKYSNEAMEFSGGRFIRENGKCDSCKKIIDHVYTSARGGVQHIIDYEIVQGKFVAGSTVMDLRWVRPEQGALCNGIASTHVRAAMKERLLQIIEQGDFGLTGDVGDAAAAIEQLLDGGDAAFVEDEAE